MKRPPSASPQAGLTETFVHNRRGHAWIADQVKRADASLVLNLGEALGHKGVDRARGAANRPGVWRWNRVRR